jgi:hypothetical protein
MPVGGGRNCARLPGQRPVRETPLEPFVDGLVWTKRVSLRFFGLPLGTRMTIVRLAEGSLFVHSPTAADAATRRAAARLGPVRFIIAPNRLHHLWIAEWAARHPDAELWGSPPLLHKRNDISWTGAPWRHPGARMGGRIRSGAVWWLSVAFGGRVLPPQEPHAHRGRPSGVDARG